MYLPESLSVRKWTACATALERESEDAIALNVVKEIIVRR